MNRISLARVVFFCYLILLVCKFNDGALLSQQGFPPFTNPNLNFTYWIFLYTNLKDVIFSSSLLKYSLDIVLTLSCLLCIVKPKNAIFPLIFTLFLWLYHFLYYSIVAYQPFAIGLLFPCIPFTFKDDLKFSLAYNFGRYFFCGLYFLAGFLKFVNAGALNVYQMSASLKMSIADYMYYNPSGFKTKIMAFLIENYQISYLLFLSAAILELTFLIGFFTKKYDLYLAGLFMVFHISNYFILDLPFINHIIILTFLIPVERYLSKLNSAGKKTKVFAI